MSICLFSTVIDGCDQSSDTGAVRYLETVGCTRRARCSKRETLRLILLMHVHSSHNRVSISAAGKQMDWQLHVAHPLVYSCLPNLLAVDVDCRTVICSNMQLAVVVALNICVHAIVVLMVPSSDACTEQIC